MMYDIHVVCKSVEFFMYHIFTLQDVKPRIIDTDMSFISENTTDGDNCIQSYEECRYEYKFQNVNSSVHKLEALRNPDCILRGGFLRKL
jgi:hypothetical protein